MNFVCCSELISEMGIHKYGLLVCGYYEFCANNAVGCMSPRSIFDIREIK